MKLAIGCAAALIAMAGAGEADAGYKPDGPENVAGTQHTYGHGRKKARRLSGPSCCAGYRFVQAESWYGFKRAIAPVRHAEHGEEVRLPSGNWVYCEFSCEYTLRKQSLDFWDGVTPGSDQVSPGYFRKDIYFDRNGNPYR